MPKRVDHEERRQQIADALLRTAARRGLHATGMREVASEAGVSLRLVQYYFGTKEELMLAAMQHLAAQFGERALARIRQIKETENPVSPRDVIAAILTEGLPADDERRTFIVLYTAYFALSLTEPALAIGPLVRKSSTVIDVVAAQLRAAQAAGDTPAWTRTWKPSASLPCPRAWAPASSGASPHPSGPRPPSTTSWTTCSRQPGQRHAERPAAATPTITTVDASLWAASSGPPRSGSRRGPGCNSAARSRAAWAASGTALPARSTWRIRRGCQQPGC